MRVQPAEVVHASILATPGTVVSYLSDMKNWKEWAPWIRSAERIGPGTWTLETDAGSMKVRFTEPKVLGILDHEVTLESGVTVVNAMRVVPNGDGSELLMLVLHRPDMSALEFRRDVEAVRADLARLRKAAETFSARGGASR
jgi:hypothetical protein